MSTINIIDIYITTETKYDCFIKNVGNYGQNVAYRLVWQKYNETEKTQVEGNIITLGISSRNRKIFGKPMIEILLRICHFHCIEIIIFPDELVKNYPVQDWPVVDALLCFYAKGYPLNKAWTYVMHRKPFVLNEINFQKMLFSRKDIYRVLTQNGIPVPEYITVERDPVTLKPLNGAELIEDGDTIIFDGRKLTKPFVEKPLDSENHNVTIYLPGSIGGGCQKLFRKMGNRSSFFCRDSNIRRDASYQYEQFALTEGADVKVYCVGPEYAYAEARKSPALDGKVERDFTGKEMRFPVILSTNEKFIARKVVELFKQTVCGIDMLRATNKCLVCDVNGLSFVKKSSKYYEDCAHMITSIIYDHFHGELSQIMINPPKLAEKSPDFKEIKKESTLELISVIAIVRHGDRTPKQKMKMLTRNPEFFKLYHEYGGNSLARIKLKKPAELQDVLDVTNKLLEQPTINRSGDAIDNPAKLLQMKYVLEMYGEFLGFNRKVQIKSLDDKRNKILEFKFRAYHPNDVSKVDFSEQSLLLILKWGGELTEVGRFESEQFGQNFAKLYPISRLCHTTNKIFNESKFGTGLIRLHSTYRHSMKVFASDEGRVQLTAAAFARGMLSLEGQLAPILVHLVKCDTDTTRMLDSCNQVEFRLHEVKKNLHDKLSVDRQVDDAFIKELTAPNQVYLQNQLRDIGNPVEACRRIHGLISELHKELTELFQMKNTDSYLNPSVTSSMSMGLCHSETYELMIRRWGKLLRDFKMQNDMYDMSLIPDIYDCARYDYFHNSVLKLKSLPELYERCKQIAHVIIAQEYGITAEEKFSIGKDVCSKLISKISSDLKHIFSFFDDDGHILDADMESSIANPHRRVRTRLYFTSESHIYGLMNVLRYSGLFDSKQDSDDKNGASEAFEHFDRIGELDFLSHVLIMQYEDLLVDINSEERFKVQVYYSPGNKRNKPITKSKQLARPLIDKNHIRSRSFFNSKSANLITRDDISASYLPSSEERKSSSPESKASDIFRSAKFSYERAPSPGNNYFSPNNMTQALNELRKPHSAKSMNLSKYRLAIDSIFDLVKIGNFIPRSKIVSFFDSLAEKDEHLFHHVEP